MDNEKVLKCFACHTDCQDYYNHNPELLIPEKELNEQELFKKNSLKYPDLVNPKFLEKNKDNFKTLYYIDQKTGLRKVNKDKLTIKFLNDNKDLLTCQEWDDITDGLLKYHVFNESELFDVFEKFQNYIDWVNLSHYDIPEEFVIKCQDKIEWRVFVKCCNWKKFSRKFKLQFKTILEKPYRF